MGILDSRQLLRLVLGGAVLLSLSACAIDLQPTETAPVGGSPTVGATQTVSSEPTPLATSTPGVPIATVPEAKYLLLSKYDLFYCDPYEYPIGRPDAEREAAIAQFDHLRTITDEFEAITEHLGLGDATEFTDDQKVQIFREHNRLNGFDVYLSGDDYRFQMRATEADGGHAVSGTVSAAGQIEIETDEQSINTCPICLISGTAISTPYGDIPVEDVKVGTLVWSIDSAGKRVAAPVIETIIRPVSPGQQVISISLDDGRSLTASPAHPTADGRPIAALKLGDRLNGAEVVAIEWIPLSAGATYDILPAGETGFYWADGILLGSTLGPGPGS